MLSSLLSGGITGVIGSVVSNITDIFKERQKQKFEVKKRELDLAAMDKEYEFQMNKIEVQTDADLETAAMDLMAKSYAHDTATYSKGLKIQSAWLKGMLVFADFVRALVRPVLTIYLIYMLWDTRVEAKAILDALGVDAVSPEKAMTTYAAITDTICYMAGMALSWWFGTRPGKAKKL